ncbi:MAG TPA: phosphopantothenoylcysteine decarboxylase [Tepidisphaeraceae bacterium]
MPRFLVTAGNTREKIDAVRDWGNIFTGNTGFSIARALLPLGEVHLLTSNAAHREEAAALGMTADGFTSHAELDDALSAIVPSGDFDAIFMTAAVADYAPAGAFALIEQRPMPDGTEQWIVRNVSAGKVKSSHPAVAFLGRPTTKLIDRFRRDWNYRRLLVKFKLEVGLTPEQLLAVGRASRIASDADYLIANTLDMVTGESAGAFLISPTEETWIPRAQLASRCAAIVTDYLSANGSA